MFSKIGKETKVLLRSRPWVEKGIGGYRETPEVLQLNFTEDGNWDLVGNNTPVFR
jgi:catalase